ncbi:hypothetical protein Leryth_003820 [Lithospermum erythrorhizon]|nr:hypothetical protein Leryth_003820 [Lithospermum erythrorhizon]
MAISFTASTIIWITFLIMVTLIGQLVVAGRPLMAVDIAGARHLTVTRCPSSMYEQAKECMSSLFAKLASGPSPKGPGGHNR